MDRLTMAAVSTSTTTGEQILILDLALISDDLKYVNTSEIMSRCG
jgi:hypothetical protein